MYTQLTKASAVFLAAIVLTAHPLLAQPGNSGLAFLKLGVSGRGVSMGDAMSASVSGAASTYYNPAGILPLRPGEPTSQIMFMHKEWIQDTRTEFLGANFSLSDNDAVGLSVNSTTVSDIEIRTRPGPAEGTFTSRDFSLGLTYARSVDQRLHLGITAKFLYEKILIDEASGYAVDLGAQYSTPVEHLCIGAVLGNLGSLHTFRTEKTVLPALLRIGPAYTIDVSTGPSTLTLAFDLMYIFPETRTYLNTGVEFLFDRIFAARAGYQFGSAGRGLSTGVGVVYGLFSLDYAYARISADLGDAHTISLALNL